MSRFVGARSALPFSRSGAMAVRPTAWKTAPPQKQAPAARPPQVARGLTTDLPDQPRGVPVVAVPPLPAAWQQAQLVVPLSSHSFVSPRPPLLPLAMAPSEACALPGHSWVVPPIPLPVLALRSASLAALTATTLPPWKHASTWIKFAVELLARHTAKAYKDICQEVVGIHLKRRLRARSS